MNPKLIVIDGKTYKSIDEMPEDVRRNYESALNQLGDSNKDGIPDMLENLTSSTDQNKNGMPDAIENMVSNVFTSSTKLIVNGTEYNSLDELSPELRAKYEQAMGSVDANGNGIPDFIEGFINTTNQTGPVQHSHVAPTSRVSTSISSNPTIEPESTSGWMIAMFVIALLGVCAVGAVGVWYFFLR